MRRIALCGTVLLALGSLHCSLANESDDKTTSGVTAVDCETLRGTFVNASDWATGTVAFSCASAQNVALNGTAVAGSGSYQATPRFGLNILHVEGPGVLGQKSDIPFIYGNFLANGAAVPEAVAVRVNPTGWVSPDDKVHLPLVSSAPLDLSDVATQVLRDQGDLLAQFDGFQQDISGTTQSLFVNVAYTGSLTVDSVSYDSTNVAISVVPNATGLTINLSVPSIAGQFDWTASALGINLGDTVTVSADSLTLSVDVNLAYAPADGNGNPATIVATLGTHQTNVQNLQIGTLALQDLPFGGPEIEAAVSDGTEYVINHFGDQLLSMVQTSLVPPITTSLQQFNLPSTLALPLNLGTLNFAETFDNSTFDATGDQLSIGASVSPATNVLSAPGSLTIDSQSASFDTAPPFGLSLSLDYVNQALYSVWVQGGLKMQVLGGQTLPGGVTTDPVTAMAAFPMLLTVKDDGSGLSLQEGEVEIGTTLHGVPTLGDVTVKVAVSIIADADIALNSTNDSITLALDATNSSVTVDLIDLPPAAQNLADQVTNLVNNFMPQALQAVATQFAPPPIPIPTVPLGLISPAFQGLKGTFSGNLVFDGQTQRVYLTGDLISH